MERVTDEDFLPDDLPDQQMRRRNWLRGMMVLALVIALAFVLGFFVFLSDIEKYHTDDISNLSADGIVVLTGGYARLGPAVELLKEERGERLLISGVNRATSDNLLKNVLKIDDALYDCCVDVDQDALDTIGNAIGTAHWASSKNYANIIVVTNDYHMPRSLMELSRKLGDIELLPYPVRNTASPSERTSEKFDRYRVLFVEYGKYLASMIRGIGQSNGVKSGSAIAGLSTGW